nr:hypothetical protein [Helicobacter felis]
MIDIIKARRALDFVMGENTLSLFFGYLHESIALDGHARISAG